MAAAAVLVGWNRDRTLIRVRHRGGAVDDYPPDVFFSSPPLLPDTEVHAKHAEGAAFLIDLEKLRRAGKVSSVTVRSPLGHRTLLVGTALRTLMAWAGLPWELKAHPAAAVLDYAPRGDLAALALVVGRTFNPRWFFNPASPNRWARLESSWGLEPRRDDRGDVRRSILVSCWGGPGEEPADFFGRYHAALLDTGRSDEHARRLVGRKFLRAMVSAWLDDGHVGDPLYDQDRLFDATAVAAVRGKNKPG